MVRYLCYVYLVCCDQEECYLMKKGKDEKKPKKTVTTAATEGLMRMIASRTFLIMLSDRSF